MNRIARQLKARKLYNMNVPFFRPNKQPIRVHRRINTADPFRAEPKRMEQTRLWSVQVPKMQIVSIANCHQVTLNHVSDTKAMNNQRAPLINKPTDPRLHDIRCRNL